MDEEQRGLSRITSGLDLYDRDANKIGTIAAVHRRERPGAPPDGVDGTIEVKTGFFGLGKHYYIPFSAVRDLTEEGVFLNVAKANLEDAWLTKPASLDTAAPADEVLAPHAEPAGPVAGSPYGARAMAAGTWEEAVPHFRARWQERYAAAGVSWETYQDRYRFAWDMARREENSGRSWADAEPDLRRNWEVLHPLIAWDEVDDAIRDVWGQRAASPSGAGA